MNKENVERKREKAKNAMDYFDEIISAEKPSKDLLNNVLKEIKIYHDKTIEFELKLEIGKLIQFRNAFLIKNGINYIA